MLRKFSIVGLLSTENTIVLFRNNDILVSVYSLKGIYATWLINRKNLWLHTLYSESVFN